MTDNPDSESINANINIPEVGEKLSNQKSEDDEDSSDENSTNKANPSLNQYCYINLSYKERKKLDEKDGFYKLEYQTINNRIDQIRNNQITLLTASISSTAVIWGLTYYFTKDNGDYISSVFFLIPLFFLIPSLIIFFDKSISYSKLIGYLRIIEQINTGFIKFDYYRGYGNYDKCFHCNYLNSCHINLFKRYKSRYPKYKEEKKCDSICKDAIKDHFSKIASRLKDNYFRYHNPIITSREYRFLSIGFFSYSVIVAIGYIFALYTGYKNNLFIENYEIFIEVLFLLIMFCYVSFLLISGIYNQYSQEYWKKCHSRIKFIFPFFVILIWIIMYIYYENITLSDALSNLPQIMGILLFLLIFSTIIMIIVLLPIFILYKYLQNKRKSHKDQSNDSEKKKEIFSKYGDPSILSLDSTYFGLRASLILIYLILAGFLIVENIFIAFMLLIAFSLIAIFAYCLNIFFSIIIGRDNANNYEILWFSAIDKTNKFYKRLDRIDESLNDITTFKEDWFNKSEKKD